MWQDGEYKPTPQQLLAGTKLVSFEGTTYTVSYSYRGQAYSFTCTPNGFDLDVDSVYQALNAFMKQIGREDWVFRLADAKGSNGVSAMFVCAKEAPFREAAANLAIPLANRLQ